MRAGVLTGFIKFYKNLSIKYKLLFILYLQIMIPLILIGYMSYQKSSEIIRNKSIMYSQDILRTIELRLSDYFNNLNNLSQDLLYDQKIYDIMNQSTSVNNLLDDYVAHNEIKNILKKVLLSRSEVQSISFITRTGKSYSSDSNTGKTNIKDILPYEAVLTKAREGNGKVIWYLDSNGEKVENIFLARTVNNIDNFGEIGLMVIMIKKEFLETVYQGLLTEAMQNIAIISENNEVVISRNPNTEFLLNQKIIRNLNRENGSFIDDSTGTLISYVSMDELGWKIITPISLELLYQEINILKRWLFLLSVVTIGILSILGIYIAVDILNPINRLVKGMENMQKGEEHQDIEIDRNDELGFLSRTFNKMSAEINHLVKWIYREQITRKEAELKALQSQINPHFLFNTLESINWMAQLNGVPEISETVTSLSGLMELNIGRDDKLITIEQEVMYIENYINILKKRFEDRIELVKNVQPEVLAVRIPRLLIQPLIENAVYHGIEKSRKKGRIELNAFTCDRHITIEVIDNGLGMDEEELSLLNEKLSIDSDTYFRNLSINKSKSVGLENVNRRIKLFYGDHYGLKIESKYGAHTKVVVRIPVHREVCGKEGYLVQSINY